MLIAVFLQFLPEGHREPCNKIKSLSSVKHLVGIDATWWKLISNVMVSNLMKMYYDLFVFSTVNYSHSESYCTAWYATVLWHASVLILSHVFKHVPNMHLKLLFLRVFFFAEWWWIYFTNEFRCFVNLGAVSFVYFSPSLNLICLKMTKAVITTSSLEEF